MLGQSLSSVHRSNPSEQSSKTITPTPKQACCFAASATPINNVV